MKRFYKSDTSNGYREIISGSSGLDLIRFGVLNLAVGQSIRLESGEYETGLVILSGKCNVVCDGKEFTGIGSRADVFSGDAAAVYIPIDSAYSVVSASEAILEVCVCMVKAEKKHEPFAVFPKDVVKFHRGKLNWQRDGVDIINAKYENCVDRIIVGETFSYPGQWSSYPPHKHDRDNPPYEINMEEVYYYKVKPSQGFGVQVLYNGDLTLDECHTVRNGDTIAIKEGYHPVVCAPGYQLYYLWVMAGTSGRELTPYDDPEHKWLRAVEQMV